MGDFQQNTITNRQAVLDYIDANSGGGGTQDLQSVLAQGSSTGLNNIDMDTNSAIRFANNSLFKEGTIDAGLSGVKGVAQICSVGYELKWEAGRLYVMEQGGTQIRQSLYNFNNTPTVDDDDTKGYVVGSTWTLDNGNLYSCSDATTGAAVWTQVTTQLDYTEYVAYITQNSPNPPIAAVAKNDTGFTFTYFYSATGDYTITATGAFTDYEKVIPSFNGQGVAGFVNVFYNTVDTLGVLALDATGLASDSVFIGNLTIRIYN